MTRPPRRTQFLAGFRPQDHAGPEWRSIERVFDRHADAAQYRDNFNNNREGAPPCLEVREVERVVEPAVQPVESGADLGPQT
jgi:hypothetical protein